MPSFKRQVVLRFHVPGHVRFALPKALCQPAAQKHLLAGLRDQAGVNRVELFARQRKLSIRYAEETIGFKRLTAALAVLIGQIEQTVEQEHIEEKGTGLATTHGSSAFSRAGVWASEKAQELRETVAALRIVLHEKLSQNIRNSPEKSKFFSEFLTDILVLYLIKTHWHLITQHWLKRPWQFRYEWLASLYMIYLLVSSKKPKPS